MVEARRVLFMRLSALGDLVECTRYVRGVRRQWPEARFDLVTGPVGRALFDGLELFETIHVYDRKGGWLQKLKVISDLNRAGYDYAFDLHCNRATGFLMATLMGPAKGRVGPGLLRKVLPFSKYRRPARTVTEMLGQAGVSPLRLQPGELDVNEAFLPVSEDMVKRVSIRAGDFGLDLGKSLVVMAPGSSPGWPSKRWKPSNFRILAERLAANGHAVAVVGVAEEGDLAREIADGLAGVADLTGRLSLPELAALCKTARAALTHDSGPMHVAAAIGAPTLSLFGPTSAGRHGVDVLYGKERNRSLAAAGVSCSPCYKGICPKARHECMDAITVDEVYKALTDLMGRPAPPRGRETAGDVGESS